MEFIIFLCFIIGTITILPLLILLIFWKPITKKIQDEKTENYEQYYKKEAKIIADELEKRKKEGG